jgi:hypothetical protein
VRDHGKDAPSIFARLIRAVAEASWELGKYDATQPQSGGSIIPCSLQTRKKAPYTHSDANCIASALIEMDQADYEFAINCPRRTRRDEQVQSGFGFCDPARPQRCMDFVTGKFPIQWKCGLGRSPEVSIVTVTVSDSRHQATKMECAPRAEEHQPTGKQVRKL